MGIDGQAWNRSLRIHAKTMVKLGGRFSGKFEIHQTSLCVRLGSILSTDIYKVYNNKLKEGRQMMGINGN